jgi:cation diffusion facilitator family transporter
MGLIYMKEKIASISILVNVVLATSKIIVGIFSNSASILAAGIDSFTDIFSSLIGYIGIKISAKPADKEHPYGHYKFEVLAGVVITIIIFTTGIGIIYQAYRNFLEPGYVIVGYLSLGVMIFSALVNEIMSRFKIFYGKKENSISLLSDGVHSRIDVYTSLVILVGLFLTKYWIYTDAVLALLMGLYIIKEAIIIGKEAVESLLDVSAGPEIDEKIKLIAKKENIEIGLIKTQKKGSAITVNLEIKLPSTLSVEDATKTSEAFRSKLTLEIKNISYASIQIKSHNLETGFYKPTFSKGFGWQRKGKFEEEIEDAEGKGPGGKCVCPKCNYEITHQHGVPCSTLQCPKCKINLERK